MRGDGLALLAVPLLVLQVSRSPVLPVLASLPGGAGHLVAGLPAGVVVDRLDAWRVLIAADIVRALIFCALFLLTGENRATPAVILGLAFAAGVVTVFADTALAIAVCDVVAGPRRARRRRRGLTGRRSAASPRCGGCLTVAPVGVAWLTGLRREDTAAVELAMPGQ
jgi:hypothetical protein